MRIPWISATFMALAVPVAAAAIDLPVSSGRWGNVVEGKPDCAKPFLVIEAGQSSITERFEEGEGRCKISELKRLKGNRYSGSKVCEWDAAVPQGLRESTDGDDDRFSLRIISKTEIEYNNVRFGYCGDAP